MHARTVQYMNRFILITIKLLLLSRLLLHSAARRPGCGLGLFLLFKESTTASCTRIGSRLVLFRQATQQRGELSLHRSESSLDALQVTVLPKRLDLHAAVHHQDTPTREARLQVSPDVSGGAVVQRHGHGKHQDIIVL
jgi:hypothetical protein